MTVYKPLEVTELRKDIWMTCKRMGDSCKDCPYRYECESEFPYMDRGMAYTDYVPADYELNENKTLFIVKEVK